MTTDVPISIYNQNGNPDHANTLLDQIRWLYTTQPDKTALTFIEGTTEQTLTYGEFFAQSARFAHALEQVGLQPSDLVVLIQQHSTALLYGFWGALMLGAVPSIFPFLTDKLDRDRYFDSTRQLVQHSGVKAIITYSALEAELRAHLPETTLINAENLQPGGDVQTYLARTPAQPEDTAFLQHSSGSTGLQKGVMLSHRAVMNQIAAYSTAIHLKRDDVVVSWLPLYHDMGLIAGFIMPLLQGLHLVLMSPFQWVRDPKMLLWAIDKHQGTLCWLPNFAYNFLATRIRDDDLAGLDLSSLRAIINCSEPVYAESHRLFAERFTPYGLRPAALATCYAMAENTFAVTQAGIDRPLQVDVVDRLRLMEDQQAIPTDDESSQMFVSCGAPIPNCEVRIVDEANQPLPERHIGEIVLRSDSMLSGYYRREELSATAILDGWYHTGDMGYFADGELYITGRKKDLIIVGGKNVYPQDIENLLNDIPGLHPGRATAFGVYNDRLGTEDLAIVAETNLPAEDKSGRNEVVRTVRARIAQNTDVTARYVQLVEKQWLIKTSSGKIARSANRTKFLRDILNLENGA